MSWNIGNRAIGKILFSKDESRQIHPYSLLSASSQITLCVWVFICPALLQHQRVLSRSKQIKSELVRLGPVKHGVTQALLVPQVEVPMITPQEIRRKHLG